MYSRRWHADSCSYFPALSSGILRKISVSAMCRCPFADHPSKAHTAYSLNEKVKNTLRSSPLYLNVLLKPPVNLGLAEPTNCLSFSSMTVIAVHIFVDTVSGSYALFVNLGRDFVVRLVNSFPFNHIERTYRFCLLSGRAWNWSSISRCCREGRSACS